MKHHLLAATAILAAGLATTPALHAQAAGPSFLLGSPATAATADRVIALGSDTRWVNVMTGETVRFTLGDREFAWTFDGQANRSFDLREIAPAGLLAQPVLVYVTRKYPNR